MPIPHFTPLLADLSSLPILHAVFLVLAVGLALAFEFVNGFHDTANAVATVIYTHALRPTTAVVWSGLCNLTGVMVSSGLVAFSIVALLPVELVLNIGSAAGFAMVFALLISAILWNLGTWYLGLPASSSHTLIGSIMGVGLANSLMTSGAGGGRLGEGINWHEVQKVFLSLLISPVIGFVCSAALLLLAKLLIKSPSLYSEPKKDAPPPGPIRALLILTCTGVSFAHGSNDGQKGMGLLLLILVGILPASYALNHHYSPADISRLRDHAAEVAPLLDQQARLSLDSASPSPSPTGALTTRTPADELGAYLKSDGVATARTFHGVAALNHRILDDLEGLRAFTDLSPDQVRSVRTDIYLVSASLKKLASQQLYPPAQMPDDDRKVIKAYTGELTSATQYIPIWVKITVALSLGLGTMIGWKRIVVTVGEKIGKTHLSYAQGASAELVAMTTIAGADVLGLPVSTTHVLSSGVAGTMAANRSGLQMSTLRSLLLAWVLTLPVCVILGAVLFSSALFILFHGPLYKVLAGAALLAVAGVTFLLLRNIRPAHHPHNPAGPHAPPPHATAAPGATAQ